MEGYICFELVFQGKKSHYWKLVLQSCFITEKTGFLKKKKGVVNFRQMAASKWSGNASFMNREDT
jgi:hypothetical protein